MPEDRRRATPGAAGGRTGAAGARPGGAAPQTRMGTATPPDRQKTPKGAGTRAGEVPGAGGQEARVGQLFTELERLESKARELQSDVPHLSEAVRHLEQAKAALSPTPGEGREGAARAETPKRTPEPGRAPAAGRAGGPAGRSPAAGKTPESPARQLDRATRRG